MNAFDFRSASVEDLAAAAAEIVRCAEDGLPAPASSSEQYDGGDRVDLNVMVSRHDGRIRVALEMEGAEVVVRLPAQDAHELAGMLILALARHEADVITRRKRNAAVRERGRNIEAVGEGV